MHTATALHAHILAFSATSCATVLWRDRGQLRVTAIVKATFAFAPDEPMRLVEPAPIIEREVHQGGSPNRSIVAPGDLAPYLPRADVLLVGRAHAPAGAPAAAVAVRLMIARDAVLLTKTLHAVGDRGEGGALPFQEIPLEYERALGGAGQRDNPLGVGAGSDRKQPNVVDPARPDRPAGFAPISRTWPARRSLITAEQRKALELPVPEVSDGFDWSYFQAAPPDQRIEHLHGDEWIVMDGMHRARPRLATRLPGAHAAARVVGYGPGGAGGYPLHLVADTLYIDAEAERCSVTWRGSFTVPGEEALAGMRILAGVELPGAPIPWPEESAAAAGEAAPIVDEPSTMQLGEGEIEIVDGEEEETAARAGMAGLERTQVIEPAAATRIDLAPPAPPARPAEPDSGRTQFLDMPEPAPGSERTRILDAPAPAPGSERTRILAAPAAAPGDFTTTAKPEPRDANRAVLPFAPPAAPAAARSPAAPIPGAPWAAGAIAPPVPRARPNLESTMDFQALTREIQRLERGPAPPDEPEVQPPERLQPLAPQPLAPPPGLGGAPIVPPDVAAAVGSPPALLRPLAEVEEVRGKPLPPEPVMVRQPPPPPPPRPSAPSAAAPPPPPPRPAAPAAAPPPPRPAAPAAVEGPASGPWRPAAPEAPAPAPPPKPQARPTVKGDIYKKFTKR